MAELANLTATVALLSAKVAEQIYKIKQIKQKNIKNIIFL